MADNNDVLAQVQATGMATQTILVGLFRVLSQKGFDASTLDEAFNFAADMATNMSLNQGKQEFSKQATEVLRIIDDIRSVALD